MSADSQRPVVVVTGASAGVGRATVRAFAAEGYDVGLIARDEAGLEAARDEVESAGGRALVLRLDVADGQAVDDAVERVERELGPIDVWVNNAMVSVFAPFWEVEPDEFRRVTEVTYLGYVNGTRAALRHMRPRNRGAIVMVGSALAYRSIPLQSAYCGAKSAIVGFTDSIRAELLHEGSAIHLTAVHLPAHNTPQFRLTRSRLQFEAQPVPPIFQPELAAEAIVWASRHRRREVHLATPTIAAILGQKVLPGFMDWYVKGTWEAQMTPEPRDVDRPDNLFAPVEGDHGAHGPFDERARRFSAGWWLERNRPWLTAAGTLAGTALAAAVIFGRRR